jgi:hypothetical protein
MAALLLLLVLLGFGRTLYLRGFFAVSPIAPGVGCTSSFSPVGLPASRSKRGSSRLLVLVAVALRRNAQAHKRLMLLASMSIVAPALARIAQWPVLGPPVNAQFVVLAVVGSFLLVGVLLIYDLVTRRRPHPATFAGGAFLVAAKLVAVLAIAQSGLGRSLVPGLG